MRVGWAAGRPRRLGARVAATLVLLVALAATGSNSAVVSLLTGIVVAGLLAVYARRGLAACFATLVGVLVVAFAGTSVVSLQAIEQRAEASSIAVVRDGIGRGASSVAERTTILHESLQLYRTGSILGSGPVSTKTRLAQEQAPYVKEAHDDYVATLIERGLIGSLGLVLLLGGIGQRAATAATRPLVRGYASAVPHPAMLAGATAGVLVGGAFNELLHTRQVWAVLGLVAALAIWGAGGRAHS
jgi:O-antigen ligase